MYKCSIIFALFFVTLIYTQSSTSLSSWVNSPQCSTDTNFCQVYCPQETVLVDCLDVGNGTNLVPNCDYKTNSCTAKPDPGEEGSPACQILCQNPYPNPPTQSNPPPISGNACKKIVQYTFTVTEETMNLDGALRSVLTINGNIPGPTINIDLGDSLHIHVINNLPAGYPLSFHWYGLPQLDFPSFDGVANITECPSCPGETIDYLFCPNVTGTYWYHSSVSSQRVDGLFGTIIVNDPNVDPYSYYDDERVVLMTEWYHRSSQTIEDEINEMNWIGDFLPGKQSAIICSDSECSGCAVNCTQCCSPSQQYMQSSNHGYCGSTDNAPGVSLNCSAAHWMEYNVNQNATYRFRFISAASSYVFRVSIDNHTLQVVAVDGNHFVTPKSVEFIDISMGQRYDVLVEANQVPGNYWIRGEGQRNFGAYAILHYVNADPIDPYNTYAPDSVFMLQESTMPYIQLNLTSPEPVTVATPTLEIAMKIGCCENLTCTSTDCSNSNPSATPSISKSSSLTPSITPSITSSASVSGVLASATPSTTTSSSVSPPPPSPSTTPSKSSGKLKRDIPPIFPAYNFGINDFNRTHAVDDYCNYPDGLVKQHACWIRLLSNITNIYNTKQPFSYPETPSILTAYEAGENVYPPPQYTIVLNRGDQVRLVINNEDVHSVHSIHLHGQSFLLLGQGAQLAGSYNPQVDNSTLNLVNPIARDTILILPSSWVVIQFEAVNPGTWYFHDQLQWNLLAGMGLIFNEITDDLPLPPGNARKPCGQCGAAFVAPNDNPSPTPSPTPSVVPSVVPTTSGSGDSSDTCDSHTGLWITAILGVSVLCLVIGGGIGVAVVYFYIKNKQETLETTALVNKE